MRSTRFLMVGALGITSLVACSSSFDYRRFSPEFKKYPHALEQFADLNLLAAEKDGSQDRKFSDCIIYNANGTVKGSNCVLFFLPEYTRAKNECEEAFRKVKKCGKACE
jgi:hypothetical protein